MDSNKIEQLLAKYWESETSLEEEKELREFFNGPNVPDHLKQNVPLFKFFKEEKKSGKLDPVFDQQVLDKIESLDNQKPKKGKVVVMYKQYLQVAAAVLVLVVAGYFIKEEYYEKEKEVQPYISDTFEDPQKAFEETKKALQMISANFKKGRQEAKKISVFSEAQEKAKDIEKEL